MDRSPIAPIGAPRRAIRPVNHRPSQPWSNLPLNLPIHRARATVARVAPVAQTSDPCDRVDQGQRRPQSGDVRWSGSTQQKTEEVALFPLAQPHGSFEAFGRHPRPPAAAELTKPPGNLSEFVETRRESSSRAETTGDPRPARLSPRTTP